MRTLKYVNTFRNKAAECETVVLMCIDFRFRKNAADALLRAGFHDFDLLALPGASKALIDETTRTVLLDAVGLAVALHRVRRIIVVDHADCARYGGSSAFARPNDEEAFHVARLSDARAIVKEEYPSVEVVLAYMDWNELKILP